MPHFTHTRKWGLRPKYTSAVHTLSLLRKFRLQDGSRTVAHPVRVQAIFWDRASQVGGTVHVLSSSVRTLLRLSILWMLRGRGCARDGTEQNADSEEAFSPVVLNLFFHRAALWSKCKSHGPHACHLHIMSSIQTNQIYNIIYRLNIIISKRLHLLK